VTGSLTLVGTPIGNLGDLSTRAVSVLRDADVIAAEDTRRTRALLTHAGVAAAGRLVAVHEHNEAQQAPRLIEKAKAGAHIAYVTDAGMPGISDPGERLVRRAVAAGVPVSVVPGPSAVLAALVVSGLPTGRFAFEGFLPVRGSERSERLLALAAEDRTIVLFESPRRVARTLADLERVLGADRPVVVARELTKIHEEVLRTNLRDANERMVAGEPRGEYVIVVAPPPARPVADDETVYGAVSAALASGETARDAATAVARDLGISRRRAYEAATAIRRRGSGGANGGEVGDGEGLVGGE
jgi:16S rRNA (cytidine1402-2'-O)-methyltransferase